MGLSLCELSTHDSWYQSQSLGETISSASEASTNNQQNGKKNNDKNKDVMSFMEKRLLEIDHHLHVHRTG